VCRDAGALHANEAGRGAVTGVCAGGAAAAGLLVTAGADCTLRVCDPVASFRPLHCVKLRDYPYSLAVAGGLALVGCGDGSLWVVELSTGKIAYCLGANQHAVRCLEASADRLFAAGDDGAALLWQFEPTA
jgi:hypothetical protein